MSELLNKSAHTNPTDGLEDSPAMENAKQCPICRSFISEYGSFGSQTRQNAKCPQCNSLERHRALWLYLENHTSLLSSHQTLLSVRLLHFAPERIFHQKFAALENIDYYPVDINPKRYKEIRDVIDIQCIEYQDGMFDFIICSHVLEHVPDDHAAMQELLRVLKQDGVAFILAPVTHSLETTLDDPSYNTPELRTQHYGQHDHLRRYGSDFPSRLRKAGFSVEEIDMTREIDGQKYDPVCYGIKEGTKIYKCTVPAAT